MHVLMQATYFAQTIFDLPHPLHPGQDSLKQFPTTGPERLDLSRGLPWEVGGVELFDDHLSNHAKTIILLMQAHAVTALLQVVIGSMITLLLVFRRCLSFSANYLFRSTTPLYEVKSTHS